MLRNTQTYTKTCLCVCLYFSPSTLLWKTPSWLATTQGNSIRTGGEGCGEKMENSRERHTRCFQWKRGGGVCAKKTLPSRMVWSKLGKGEGELYLDMCCATGSGRGTLLGWNPLDGLLYPSSPFQGQTLCDFVTMHTISLIGDYL